MATVPTTYLGRFSVRRVRRFISPPCASRLLQVFLDIFGSGLSDHTEKAVTFIADASSEEKMISLTC